MQPSEAWALDIVEICILFDNKFKHAQDMSIAVNKVREFNGMPKGLIKNRCDDGENNF